MSLAAFHIRGEPPNAYDFMSLLKVSPMHTLFWAANLPVFKKPQKRIATSQDFLKTVFKKSVFYIPITFLIDCQFNQLPKLKTFIPSKGL